MVNIIEDIVMTVLGYLRADWLILLIGILLAVSISVYVDSNKLKNYLEKNSKLSVPGSVAFGAFTPLCACGTMAVLLSMFVSSMPWGPVMAFLVSSPLTSPSGYMFQTAFFGTKFAIAVAASSIVLGLSAGFIAHLLEMKTGFFKGQFRLSSTRESCCDLNEVDVTETGCCGAQNKPENITDTFIKKYKIDMFIKEFVNIGIKKILLFFTLFIAIGRIVEIIIPKEWILAMFSGDKSYSVPLGATIGLPLYVSGSAALPLMKSFMNSGAGQGAILAFLIAGKATGVPVIAGISVLLKKRAVFFYVSFVYVGGIVLGYIYQLLLNMGM